ncbi:MAG: YjjG family noncanonical pyrimidine nucleotidase [Spirochaetales bacterium]|nr:YjjG family noncanonical pyrimidine nucleotidase [Spirochaetales bacterium]
MKRYEYLLIDADGTFLDFEKTESRALNRLMDSIGWKDRDYFVRTYSGANRAAWDSYESGKIPSEEINQNRFEGLYEGLLERSTPEATAGEMADFYLGQLGRGDFLIEGGREFLDYLKGRYVLILATNGLAKVQRARISRAGLKDHFDSIAISQELGVHKPMREYYEKALEGYDYDRDRVLMIGDSLKTDMSGADAFGIDSCWFNPGEILNDGQASPTYEISRLDEIKKIL